MIKREIIIDGIKYFYSDKLRKHYEDKYFLGTEDATIKAIGKELCNNQNLKGGLEK